MLFQQPGDRRFLGLLLPFPTLSARDIRTSTRSSSMICVTSFAASRDGGGFRSLQGFWPVDRIQRYHVARALATQSLRMKYYPLAHPFDSRTTTISPYAGRRADVDRSYRMDAETETASRDNPATRSEIFSGPPPMRGDSFPFTGATHFTPRRRNTGGINRRNKQMPILLTASRIRPR